MMMMANCLQQSIRNASSCNDKSNRVDDGATEYNDRMQPTSGGRLNGSAERPLKFSIDNILRPEFGGGAAAASDCSLPAAFNHYNHHYHQHIQQQQQQHLNNIDRLNHLNYQLHHLNQLNYGAVTAAAVTAVAATTSMIRDTATTMVTSSSSDHDKSNSSRRSSSSSVAEPPSSPIDLSCTDSQTGTNPEASTTANTASTDSATDKDASGSQQWPAWVYCTRYSDRPSSGKSWFT